MKIEENGYRYYSYEQLYQIGFILGLRDLGLLVEEIKDYLGDSSRDALNKKVIPLKNKIELRIQNLKQILAILRQKENDNFQLTDVDFYVVKECFLPDHDFWCSDFKADCSEVKIASSYSQFYQELGAGVMANKNLSGFITDLPQAKVDTYANSGAGIEKGLTVIRKYAKENNFKIGNDVWQFNIGLNIEKLGLTKNGILAYKILK